MSKFFNFKTLVSFTALAIAGCAALFSVTGIGTLFAGAAVSAMVMASALELGKLVGVSFLYRYWPEIPRTLKSYMLVASIVLVGITSAGIYGYLSSAYAKVAAEPLKMNADIQIYNSQIETLDQEIQRKTARLDQIISLRGQQENRIDNLISKSTTGSNSTIRSAQNSLAELTRTATTLQREINQTSAQRDSLKAKSLTKEVEINTNSDIGTFVYISKAIGVSLDSVVKWFILIIVLVFDPLSICLVLAYNFLVKRENKKEVIEENVRGDSSKDEQKTYQIYGEEPIELLEKEIAEIPDKDVESSEVEEENTVQVNEESIKTEEALPEVNEEPQVNNDVTVRPWKEENIELSTIPKDVIEKLNTDDPFPQYMTKEETEEVLERWWQKKNGNKHISVF